MDYPIKNVTDIPNIEDIAGKIWREILDSKDLAPYIEDWSRNQIEKELAEGRFQEHREIQFKKVIDGYAITCHASITSGLWNMENEEIIDEVTGNYYNVYDDLQFNINWSSFGSTPEDFAREALELINTVFVNMVCFVSPYRNKQSKMLIYTKEDEEKRQVELEKKKEEAALYNLQKTLIKDIPEKTKGMRVSDSVSAQITYPKIDKIGTCDFELSIKKKIYRCWVYDGVAETKVTIYRKI
jgi:hypothetical protein